MMAVPRKRKSSAPALVLAADVGGTNTRCALVDRRGRIVCQLSRASRGGRSPAAMVSLLADVFGELLAGESLSRVPPVGIGVAGGVDVARGLVTQAPQFAKWKNFPLASRLQRRLGSPVTLCNDVDAALLGELWRGAAKGETTVAAYWLGTGLGGALYLGGRLWRGPSAMAGELGHVVADPGGARCRCGARGCLETLASAYGVERMARQGAAAGRPVRRADASGGHLSAKDVYQAALAGDARARAIWRRVGRALGESVGSLVNELSIDRVVIGGKLARAHRFFLPELRRVAKKRAFRYPGSRLKVVLSKLGDDAGLLGAAAIATGAV